MRCRICGGLLESRVTDLPFKIGDSSIVILRSLPVLQGDTELEQATMSRVDQLLAAVDGSAELEVIRYGCLSQPRSTRTHHPRPAETVVDDIQIADRGHQERHVNADGIGESALQHRQDRATHNRHDQQA